MKYGDKVKETTSTTGTGTLTLSGAATGFVAFSTIYVSGDTIPYCIQGGVEWEVGEGVFTSPSTLTRVSVHASTNSGALVNFSAGTKEVFCNIDAYRISRMETRGRAVACNSGLDLN